MGTSIVGCTDAIDSHGAGGLGRFEQQSALTAPVVGSGRRCRRR